MEQKSGKKCHCPYCGQPVYPTDDVCVSCGHELLPPAPLPAKAEAAGASGAAPAAPPAQPSPAAPHMSTPAAIAAAIVGAILLAGIVIDAYEQAAHSVVPSASPPIATVEAFRFTVDALGMPWIDGYAVNTSGRQLSYAQVEFNLYDSSGAQVGSTFTNITNWEPGVRWHFSCPVFEQEAVTAKLKGITAW